MKFHLLEERSLLSVIRKEFSSSSASLILGIGDDGAVIKAGKSHLIITKDLLIEDFHFRTSLHPPFLLGRKSLNVNLSDIAAMGGKPKYALLGLGIPQTVTTGWLEEYFSGFKAAAEEWEVALVGGDISQAKKITISVTVIGESRRVIRRGGGKPGDHLFVSGSLGDARQGWLLLKRGMRLKDNKKADPLLRAFLDPVPQLPLARELSRRRLASSMIDISDGLSVDLDNLCRESGCGAEVDVQRMPLSPELRFWQKRPNDAALHGGEDYQLLFSVLDKNMASLVKLQKKFRLTRIGRMTREKGLYVIDREGKKKRLEIKGYLHFARRKIRK